MPTLIAYLESTWRNAPWELVTQLVISAALGGIIGFEREYHHKAAGFRTHFLVALGSTLFTILSRSTLVWGNNTQIDPTRIAAQIITGIGFIGAGAILRKEDRIEGLTTAAGIWTTAAIGMAVGVGLYFISAVSVVLIYVMRVISKFVNKTIDKVKQQNGYTYDHAYKRDHTHHHDNH